MPSDSTAHIVSHIQDIAFVLYYIVFFSWFRESLALYVLKPLARRHGIRKPAKLDRFVEQGYAVIYFTLSGSLGLVGLTGFTLRNWCSSSLFSGPCMLICQRGTSVQNTHGSVSTDAARWTPY